MKTSILSVVFGVMAAVLGATPNLRAELIQSNSKIDAMRATKMASLKGTLTVHEDQLIGVKIEPDVASYGQSEKRLLVTLLVKKDPLTPAAMTARVTTEKSACQLETVIASSPNEQRWLCPLSVDEITLDTDISVEAGSEKRSYTFYTGQPKIVLTYATPDPWESLNSSYQWPTPQDMTSGAVRLKGTFLQLYQVVEKKNGQVIGQGASNFRNPTQCAFHETFIYPDGTTVEPGWHYYAPQAVTNSVQEDCNADYWPGETGSIRTKWRMKMTFLDGSKIFSNTLDWDDVESN